MEGKDVGPTVLSSSDLITMTVIIDSFPIAISFSVLILSRSDSLIGGIPITVTPIIIPIIIPTSTRITIPRRCMMNVFGKIWPRECNRNSPGVDITTDRLME